MFVSQVLLVACPTKSCLRDFLTITSVAPNCTALPPKTYTISTVMPHPRKAQSTSHGKITRGVNLWHSKHQYKKDHQAMDSIHDAAVTNPYIKAEEK